MLGATPAIAAPTLPPAAKAVAIPPHVATTTTAPAPHVPVTPPTAPRPVPSLPAEVHVTTPVHAPAPPPPMTAAVPGAHLFTAMEQHAPRIALFRASAQDLHESHPDGHFEAFATTRYGAQGAVALASLQGIHPRFAELLVDPGLVGHVDGFRRFVDANPALRDGDPWVARQAFAESLGTRTVFRALALKPEQVDAVRSSGLDSRLVRYPNQHDVVTESTGSLRKQIDDRVGGWKLTDSLVSVAEKPRVATSVAGTTAAGLNESKNERTHGQRVYLFKLRVPAIDLVAERPGDPMLSPSPEKSQKVLDISWKDAAGRTHTTTQPFATPSVESFVLFGVQPSELEQVKEISPERAGRYQIRISSDPSTAATAPH